MKKVLFICIFAILLSGCGKEKNSRSANEERHNKKKVEKQEPVSEDFAPEPVKESAVAPDLTSIPEPTEEPTSAPEPTPESIISEPESQDPGMTTSQKQALKSAQSYLSFSAYSHDSLIDQLEFEKYSHEDALYAADNCGADWYEQACKAALNYLDFTPYSYSGLVSQLEFEKYTHDQAVYGVDQCGADWNEQAAKSAQNYLEYSAYSHDGLVDQLEFEGYTHDQAEYGVSQAGL